MYNRTQPQNETCESFNCKNFADNEKKEKRREEIRIKCFEEAIKSINTLAKILKEKQAEKEIE